MLQKQPLYILGPDNPEKSATGCYNAGKLQFGIFCDHYFLAIMYMVTFIVALSYWTYDSYKNGNPLPIPLPFLVRTPRVPLSGQNARQSSYDVVEH